MFGEKWACGLRCWSVSGRRSVPFYQQPLRTASFGSDSREASGRPGRGLSRAARGVPACVCVHRKPAGWPCVCSAAQGSQAVPRARVGAVGCLVLCCPCSVPMSRSSGPARAVWAGDRPQQWPWQKAGLFSISEALGGVPGVLEAQKGCLRRKGSLRGQGLPPVVWGDITGFFPRRDCLLVVSDGSSGPFSLSSTPGWLSGQCWGSPRLREKEAVHPQPFPTVGLFPQLYLPRRTGSQSSLSGQQSAERTWWGLP